MNLYLDFEKPLQELELKIEELKRLTDSNEGSIDIQEEIFELEKKAHALRKEIFSGLTPWQKAQIARHPERPYTLDYINEIITNFIELRGDRKFADDPAIVGGFGSIGGQTFLIVGHQKGRSTKERIRRNFGQPHPEGYRKSLRLMKLAEKQRKPILTFIDTPGAFPGIGAEERGQSEAIADNLIQMSRLKTPIISVIIGEGGSGGALALSVADRIFILEHSIYSVISPEGCAAILWSKNGNVGRKEYAKAAEALKLTSEDMLRYGVVDQIIGEPLGGAHRDYTAIAQSVRDAVTRSFEELKDKDIQELIDERYDKFRRLGQFTESR